MQRLLMLSVSSVVLSLVSNALADSPQLKGTYAFVGHAGCVISTLAFDSAFTSLPGSYVFNDTSSSRGTHTFNGDGTGTTQTQSMTATYLPLPNHPIGEPNMDFPPSRGGAGSSHSSSSFTYTVNGDGSFTLTPAERFDGKCRYRFACRPDIRGHWQKSVNG
jgi:hypothetical protein